MGVEGSNGTPSYLNALLQKQTDGKSNGVRITGLDSLTTDRQMNKGKKPMGSNKQGNSRDFRSQMKLNKTNPENKVAPTPTASGKTGEQKEENREQNDNEKEILGKAGETTADSQKKNASNYICKPKKSDTLRVIIDDP